jgi:metallo-beta-lactamase class B
MTAHPPRPIAHLIVIVASTMTPSLAPAQEPKSGLDGLAKSLAKAQVERTVRTLNRPVEPFRLIGNIHYVGPAGVSSFLIATPEGHILIDTGFEPTVPLIREGMAKLGLKFEEIKLVLSSHAHFDHVGGHAQLKELTGASIVMSAGDADLLARGGKGDVLPLGDTLASYPPARADRIVRDGETFSLGGVALTAHLAPGHTKGSTTWTMETTEDGKTYRVVFYGSTTVLPGVRLVGNPTYPTIADDFAASFRTLKTLPCDVFLAPHGAMFGLEDKARRLKAGERPNPFIDPGGYRAFVERSEQTFLDALRRQREAADQAKIQR